MKRTKKMRPVVVTMTLITDVSLPSLRAIRGNIVMVKERSIGVVDSIDVRSFGDDLARAKRGRS